MNLATTDRNRRERTKEGPSHRNDTKNVRMLNSSWLNVCVTNANAATRSLEESILLLLYLKSHKKCTFNSPKDFTFPL